MANKYTKGSHQWKSLEEWIGDGALLYLTRKELVKQYPKLPIKLIDMRVCSVIANINLYQYTKRHNMPFGANMLERVIGKMLETNLTRATILVARLVNECEKLKTLDKEQLTENGEPKSSVILQYFNHKRHPDMGNRGILRVGKRIVEVPSLMLANV